MMIRDVPAGETLVSQGQLGHEFYVLLEGTARVEQDGAPVATLGAGDFFGEIALVTRTRRTATVTATEPSRVAVFDERSFRDRLAADAEFSSRVWGAAAARY